MFYAPFLLRDGEPCEHPGCLSHISHPCEGCGRIGGKKQNNTQNTIIVEQIVNRNRYFLVSLIKNKEYVSLECSDLYSVIRLLERLRDKNAEIILDIYNANAVKEMLERKGFEFYIRKPEKWEINFAGRQRTLIGVYIEMNCLVRNEILLS